MAGTLLEKLEPAIKDRVIQEGSGSFRDIWGPQLSSASEFEQTLHSQALDPGVVHFDAMAGMHMRTCDLCSARGPCVVFLGIWYVLYLKHDPRDWTQEATTTRRKLAPRQLRDPPSQHVLTEGQSQFLMDKHAAWVKRRVVYRSKATGAEAPTFVIDKHKPCAGQEAAFVSWLTSLPPDQLHSWALREQLPSTPACVKVKQRGIYDLRQVNRSRTLSLPMHFPGVDEAATRSASGRWLAAIDYSEGYTSVPVAVSAGDVLRSSTPEGVFVHTRLPFGYWAAPFLFNFLSGETARQARCRFMHSHEYTSVYIDDTLLVLDGPEERANAVFKQVAAHMACVGFTINLTKAQAPAREVEFLGTNLDCTGDHVRVSIPPTKAAGLKLLLQLSRESMAWPRRFWRRLLGKLQAAAFMLPGSRPILSRAREVQRTPAWRMASERQLLEAPPETRQALDWFQRELDMAPSTPLSYPMAEVTEKVLAFTDASGEGGLGGVFVCQSKQTAPLERGWFSVMSQASGNKLSTELELQAILEVLIRVAQFGQRTGHQVMAVTVCTDSQAAVAAWAKGYSNKSQNITRQLQLIANTCQTHSA